MWRPALARGSRLDYSPAEAMVRKRKSDMRSLVVAGLTLIAAFTAGCAGDPASSQAMQCENGLKEAYRELDTAKANGLDGTVEVTKAASLLGAAKIQSEFGKYPNCINKVHRARAYLANARK
jgi:hypothetical protein